MKYIAIIDEEMLSNFRIDEPSCYPCYMPENDKILVVNDELGYTRGIQLKPLPKEHGRLIDADALIEQLEATANIEWNQKVGSSKGLEDAIDIVDDTPTIIGADKKLEQPDKCKFFKDADCCYPIEDCDNCPNHKENDTSDLELIIGYMSAIRKMIKGTQMDVSLFINSDENFPIAHINFLNDETGRLVKHISCNLDDEDEEEDYIWNGEGD
jgi:hypothetical protein